MIRIHHSVPAEYHYPIKVRFQKGWPVDLVCEAYGLRVGRDWLFRKTLFPARG